MSRALSILLLGDYAPDPMLGSSKVLYALHTEFTELGHRCDLVFGNEIAGPRARQIRQLTSPWYAAAAIARRLRSQHYDVVDAASAEGLGFAVRTAMSRRHTAYVCRSNGLEHLDYRRMLGDHTAGLLRKPWTKRLWYPASRLSQVAAAARMADRLLLLNEVDRQFALARGWQPAERIDVVSHGISDAFLHSRAGLHERGRGLLFCGSWSAVKGTADLVAAFQRLHDGERGVRLTILGPGVPADHVLAAFPEPLRPLVTVLPRAAEAAVVRAFSEHDVLLWPSTYEGFGLVLIEAMSQGIAIAATPVGCAATLLRDGENAIVVPTRDPASLAAAAARLLDDASLRRRLGNAARTAVAGMSWRRTAEQTIDCYRRALRSAGVTAA